MTPTERAERFVGQRASRKYIAELIRQFQQAENDALERAATMVKLDAGAVTAIRDLKHKLGE